MSDASLRSAGTLLVLFPAVVFGGASLLWHWVTRRSELYQLPLRRELWRAGHAHAGVLLLLALIAVQLVDHAHLTDGWKQLVRTTIPGSALLLPAAFFLSVARSNSRRPSRLINLAYVGGLALIVGMLALGVGLLKSA